MSFGKYGEMMVFYLGYRGRQAIDPFSGAFHPNCLSSE